MRRHSTSQHPPLYGDKRCSPRLAQGLQQLGCFGINTGCEEPGWTLPSQLCGGWGGVTISDNSVVSDSSGPPTSPEVSLSSEPFKLLIRSPET